MIDLGTVKPGSTLRIPFSSFDKDDGSSITMTNYAAADMLIYKDGGTTERASTSGFTATTDFDGKTGKHLAIVDLSDNTTAGFWNAGSEYLVAIDAVTVDAVTTGGWIARFRIGYLHAHHDTTIATLSTQTSFTLTTGPAEDDALNGSVVCIHDIASAIQCGWGVVSDYTGSTKTVTLTAGVTFTAAAGDNISFFPPVNAAYWNALTAVKLPLAPTTAGRDLDVSAGGEAGLDFANIGSPTTVVNLSGTTIKTATDVETDTADIQTRLPAALVSGRIDASVGAMAANVLTATAINADAITAAKIADGAIDRATLAADTGLQTIRSNTAASGAATTITLDASASGTDDFYNNTYIYITGGTGAGQARFISDYVGATKVATVNSAWITNPANDSTFAIISFSTIPGASAPTAADVADAVWDEAQSGHTTAGSFGKFLDIEVSSRGTGTGTALDAAGVRSAVGLASANLDTQLSTIDDFLDTEIGAIKASTDNLPSDPADESLVIAATDAIMARLGAPAGASVSADVAAVKTDTAAVKTKTDKLTFDANNAVDANVQKINDVSIVGDGSGTPFTV